MPAKWVFVRHCLYESALSWRSCPVRACLSRISAHLFADDDQHATGLRRILQCPASGVSKDTVKRCATVLRSRPHASCNCNIWLT